MPRKTKTYDLEQEVERIDKELDELIDDIVKLDEGGRMRERLEVEGKQLERKLAGLQWALDPPEDEDIGPINEVTLGALSAGEYANITDMVANHSESSDGASQVVFAANGLVDAPFIDEDMTDNQKVVAVSNLAPQFHEWLRGRVDDLSTPEVEGNGFAKRLEERESATTLD